VRWRTTDQSWLRLRWPREVETGQLLAMLLMLHGSSSPGNRETLTLRSVGSSGRVRHYLGIPPARLGAVQSQLASALPGISVEEIEHQPRIEIDQAWRAWFSAGTRPLDLKHPEITAHGVTAALAHAGPNEHIVYQWVLGTVRRPVAVGTKHPASFLDGRSGDLLKAPLHGAGELDSEARSALRDKQGLPGWRAVLHLGVNAPSEARRRQLLSGLAAAVRSAEGPASHVGFRATSPSVLRGARPWRWPLRINCGELRGLSGWPIGDVSQQPVDSVRARRLPVPPSVATRGRIVGETPDGRALALSPKDTLLHLQAIGPTGVGKSTLLLNLICQDLEAERAVVVIEPKGDLIKEVLTRIPDRRLDDVVVLDPTDRAPVGINPLGSGNAELAVDGLVAVFKGLFADSWGPRTQDVLTAGLLTLTRTPGMSLVALPLLFTDAHFRARLLARVNDPLALSPFWDWFEAISPAERAAVLAPLMNKLRAFLLRPQLRRVIGQASPSFDLRQVFTERKVLLVNLAKGAMGAESASLLGSLVLAQLWQTTLERQAIPAERRHPTMVYVDEFQDYLHLPTDLADVLAQARGLGVGLTLAHQHLAQLTPSVRAGVLANARSRVVFQTGDDDARVFARLDDRLTPSDFRGLGAYEVYASLASDSQVTGFASARTLPPSEPLRSAESVVARSRESYGVPVEEIDAALHALGDRSRETERTGPSGEQFGVRQLDGDGSETEE